MKRLHIHISVDDLDRSVQFYTILFGTKPSVEKSDYAKWVIDNPQVNLAVSKRGHKPGIDHLGIQVESKEELEQIAHNLRQAHQQIVEEKKTTCCYAKSDKAWVHDPQGIYCIYWETFLTHGSSTIYGESLDISQQKMQASACCG